jgi:Ca2+-binding RTX toxin-like protein
MPRRSAAARRAIPVLAALSAWLAFAPAAGAAQGANCPPIADKPGAVPHVDYTGVQHLTYCYGPVQIKPGQNIIRLNSAKDPDGTPLFPQVPGYITRFDPDLVYTDGSVPPVDVLHLHHAVWIVNANPQFAVGEEKTIAQQPQGYGWRSQPSDSWLVNDMLHDLVAKPATVYIVWRLDFVPDTSPAAASIKTVRTKWLDVAGTKFYPVFNATRGMGADGRYTFPDQATGAARNDIGTAVNWNVTQPSTLVATAGHLHPGGLDTYLTVTRGSTTKTIFTSNAHYYEPAGAVSWDVAMGGTLPNWLVSVKPGDVVSVHATYDVSRADWYEVMGIMPVSVYNGTIAGAKDAIDDNASIPQNEVLTHGHLRENDNHGGLPTTLPDPLQLPGYPLSDGQVDIKDFSYLGDLNGAFSRNPPTVVPGQTLTFKNLDAVPSVNAFHTITDCRAPCNGSTGIAYPVANGPVTFDSGQLGFNGNGGALPAGIVNSPAAGRDTWTIPSDLKPGTYTYFCRVHPFMRGSFRVASTVNCHGHTATEVGTDGPDVIRGTKGRDVIVGLGGNDKLIGLGAKDVLCGGDGKDTLIGGSGKDLLYGEGGRDKLRGGTGRDMLSGGTGPDRLLGGTGLDKLRGGEGKDLEKQQRR